MAAVDQPLEWDLRVVEVEVVEEVGVVVVDVGFVEVEVVEEVGVVQAEEVVESCMWVRLQAGQRRVQIDLCTTLRMVW